MTAIANAASAQQAYFQAVPKTDQPKVDPTKTGSTQTVAAATANAKAPPPSVVASAATTYKSAKTRNQDGTFGPKHTTRPPSSSGTISTTGSSESVSTVNVKV